VNYIHEARGNCIRKLRFGIVTLCVCAMAVAMATPVSIFDYIKTTWSVLTRAHRDLARAAADPKFPSQPGRRLPVYLARNEDLTGIEQRLRSQMLPRDFARLELLKLPADATHIRRQGLLYLPLPYAVPGGRFNEMYGWDSFFIQMGLLRDGDVALARDMADNFLYEIREYGKILNANRTYYLTRSQPPFLTQMLLAIYNRTHDHKWFEDSISAIETYYRYWTSAAHLTPETGLSRFFDLGDGPAPEVVCGPQRLRRRS